MGIGIYYDKLNNDAKTFLETHHKVPGAVHYAKAPIKDETMEHEIDSIPTFEGLGGEIAVGDQDAFAAFIKIAEKQNLSAQQMPKGYQCPTKEEVIEEVSLPAYEEAIVPMSCPTAPEMGC